MVYSSISFRCRGLQKGPFAAIFLGRKLFKRAFASQVPQILYRHRTTTRILPHTTQLQQLPAHRNHGRCVQSTLAVCSTPAWPLVLESQSVVTRSVDFAIPYPRLRCCCRFHPSRIIHRRAIRSDNAIDIVSLVFTRVSPTAIKHSPPQEQVQHPSACWEQSDSRRCCHPAQCNGPTKEDQER